MRNYFLLPLIILLLLSSLKAQQPLNLDFEQLSLEGVNRPWGWNFETFSAIKTSLDSTTVRHGKYSLRMQGADANALEPQILTYSIEPYELTGKTVTATGWIKTMDLEGEAFFTINYYADSGEENQTSYSVSSDSLHLTHDWLFLSVDMFVPPSTQFVNISLHHTGSGTSWFDAFSLIMEGKELNQVEVGAPFGEHQLAWMSENSFPINRVDAGGVYEDLAPFGEMVKNTRIIALGEATHGTSEFFRLKHRVLEYAVKELGVRVFAIEDNQLVVERVNRYVLGGTGNARSSMYGMFSVWQNEEVHNLIEWIRQYNDNNPADKVEFVGFDIQNLTLPLDSLFAFTQRRNAGLHQQVKDLLGDLRKEAANTYVASDSSKAAWLANAEKALELVRQHQSAWLEKERSRVDSLKVLWGIQYANLVKQHVENLLKGHASLYRDVAMAENITWILNIHPPGTKILVWAHDAHISLGEHPDEDLNIYYGKSMGSHLRKKYGKDYQAFGLWTYEGSYWAQVSYSDFRQLSCPLFPSPKGTLDEALHQVVTHKKTSALFLDLKNGRGQDWLVKPIPVRFANHVNIEYGYWTRYSIPYQFDGIFFIDRTSPAKSYAR